MIDHRVPPDLLAAEVERTITATPGEDIGTGDITSQTVIPPDLRFSGVMAARQDLVLAGIDFARDVFLRLEPTTHFEARAKDGERVSPGTVLCLVEGPARGLLTAERSALNLMQHLSGIATTTRSYADLIAGTGCVRFRNVD